MNLPLVYRLGQKHMNSEAETMRTYPVGVLLGVIPSLALGVWLGSSPSLPFSEWRENAQGEAFYQGRPTSFWLLRLEDHDSIYRLEAVQALENLAAHEPSIVPALGAPLKDRDRLVRVATAGALHPLGAAARPPLPAPPAAPQDDDPVVRSNRCPPLGPPDPPAPQIL